MAVLPDESAYDRLLQDLLKTWQARLETAEPWSRLPALTLMTGRGPEGTAWMIEKYLREAAPTRQPVLLRHLQSTADGVHVADLQETIAGSVAIRRSVLSGRNLAVALASPTDAVAIETHGVESCAQADGQVVYCGRRVEPFSESRRDLACACGSECPRGDDPYQLQNLGARIAFVASCASLRLGDSFLDPGFNLGLSFLDGPGLGYVGSLVPNGGNSISARTFLAALADGYTLSQAVNFANAHVCAAGLDSATLIAVGLPDMAVRPEIEHPLVEWSEPSSPLSNDFDRAHIAQILMPVGDSLTHNHDLAIEIEAATAGDPVTYFHRLEVRDTGSFLRLFLFRFPEVLGRIFVRCHSRSGLASTSRATAEMIDKWCRLARLAGLATDDQGISSDGEDLPRLARIGLEQAIPRSRFDGTAAHQARAICEILTSTEMAVREELVTELAPKLGGPFWLPNLYGTVQELVTSESDACPYCAGILSRKYFTDSAGIGRTVEVCARCSIISDIEEQGPFRFARIHCDESTSLGGSLVAELILEWASEQSECAVDVLARLSTPRLGPVEPDNPRTRIGCDTSSSRRVKFHFALPDHLVPHYYFVKVLMSSPGHLGFASRRIFLR